MKSQEKHQGRFRESVFALAKGGSKQVGQQTKSINRRMKMATKKNRMTLHRWNGVTVLDLGAMDIWDGADLALLRETLSQLIDTDRCRSIGVDMTHVKYVPSGFFGMLYDWHEKGVTMRLYTPQPNVANMLWFRRFFDHIADGCHLLISEPKVDFMQETQPAWSSEAGWNGNHKKVVPANGNGNGNGDTESIAAAQHH